MSELTAANILTLGATSGVLAGITNQLLGFLRDRVRNKDDREKRDEERIHAQRLRADRSHDESLHDALPKITAVSQWIGFHWGSEYGLEVDYHGAHVVEPHLSGPAEVLENLRYVANHHPTRSVRRAASGLHDSIDGFFNMIEAGEPSGTPTIGNYSGWLSASDDLIELIHLPDVSDLTN